VNRGVDLGGRRLIKKEKRQGDLHGRVNHESLGSTLHCIGNCFFQQGQWQEAAGWYEQAQAEKRQGDVYGRVNKQSLVLSLQSLAQALSFLGQEEEAKRWKDEADQIEKE
jgi:tetratricopeptide (TPR) repeat protein